MSRKLRRGNRRAGPGRLQRRGGYRQRKPDTRLPRFDAEKSANPRSLINELVFAVTGWIHGVKASKDEEVWNAGVKMVPSVTTEFQIEVNVESSLPGRGKQVDFLHSQGIRKMPVEIDGPFHDNYPNAALDAIRDAMLNRQFITAGWDTIKRVNFENIPNPEKAKEYFIQEVLSG